MPSGFYLMIGYFVALALVCVGAPTREARAWTRTIVLFSLAGGLITGGAVALFAVVAGG